MIRNYVDVHIHLIEKEREHKNASLPCIDVFKKSNLSKMSIWFNNYFTLTTSV